MMRTILHLILSLPFRLASISINSSRYVNVDRALLALLYIRDLSVQYRVYRIWSLGGGKRGITLGGVSVVGSPFEVTLGPVFGHGPVNG